MYCIKHYRSLKGFTLIELMIAIAIIAILVAIAVPAYNDYTIRAKITECINGSAVAKVAISEYQQTLGAWPGSFEEAGLAVAGISHYCTVLTDYEPATGSFTIGINRAAIDAFLGEVSPDMVPIQRASNSIDWDCTRGSTPEENLRYLPSTCRDT